MRTEVVRLSLEKLSNFRNIISSDLTINDVLVAALSIFMTKARIQVGRLNGINDVALVIPVNARVDSGIHEEYFGNALLFACPRMSLVDLSINFIPQIARHIHESVALRKHPDYLASSLAWICTQNCGVFPSFNVYLATDLAFTNWSHFPLYEFRLDTVPVRCTLTAFAWDGLVFIFPCPLEDHAIELYIGFEEKSMDKLRQDPEFNAFVKKNIAN
jgi:hypothetical protein